MIVVGLILPDHHHYHIDHHLYHRRGCFCQSLFWWAWVLAVWVDRRKGGKVKSCSLIVIISSQAIFSSYLHWDKHRLINIPWWHYDQSREVHPHGKNTNEKQWWNHHNGVLIKADKVKLCSLIIILSSQAMFSDHPLSFIGTNIVWSTYPPRA